MKNKKIIANLYIRTAAVDLVINGCLELKFLWYEFVHQNNETKYIYSLFKDQMYGICFTKIVS